MLQIAHHKGYIKVQLYNVTLQILSIIETGIFHQVDWKKMSSDSATVAEKLKEKLHIKSKSSLEKFQEWSARNIYLAGGFTGGFFLGIASS